MIDGVEVERTFAHEVTLYDDDDNPATAPVVQGLEQIAQALADIVNGDIGGGYVAFASGIEATGVFITIASQGGVALTLDGTAVFRLCLWGT